MSKTKIFITYNQKHKIINSDILIPIQTGRALSREIFDEMIGDDTGDNISELNPYYAELTAQYWVWKNYEKIENPENVGFMHYHRHFIFNENYFDNKASFKILYGYSVQPFDSIDDEYFDTIKLTSKNIYRYADKFDCIVCKRSNMKILNCENSREYFKKYCYSSHVEDYDRCMDIVEKNYPEYKDAIKELNNGSYRYFYNMFIMKKNLFFKYSEFLFSVLDIFFNQTDINMYAGKARRVCSYLGELLLSLFVINLYQSKKYKVKELFCSFVKNTFYDELLEPKWSNCKNAIACGCSNEYAPYLGTYIKSIIEHSTEQKKYDIVVFETDISDFNKHKLKQIVEGYSNISLRFYDINALFANITLPLTYYYFSKQCYYRLAVGKVFSKYRKVLFTDIDLIFNFDISSIFDIDMNGMPVAACEEILWTKNNIKGKKQLGFDIEDYIINKVKCTSTYFNTGVMIVDVNKFNNVTSFDNLLNIGLNNRFINQEQCVINQVFNGKITKLPICYNFEIFLGIYNSDLPDFKKYMKHIDDAKIYHFLTNRKAWFYPDLPKADIWWQYARQTPFYEEILARLIDFKASKAQENISAVSALRAEFAKVHFPNINNRFGAGEYNAKLSFVMNHLLHFRLKKFGYALKKAFAFGERYAKYNDKYQKTKQLIKDAKKLKKSYYKV